ncbi:UvrD-helicase domain-containing protein [Microbacterium sp. ARD31]|uniref:UvrD-helicase domain-containing protein n=1 Tax=Microbacterium sp. ARD31 TaxID=2962576 RepID=UPI0028812FBE|nr:UvrD-helicase domain-containing protein [Microbacterium sp. ARD31]MDT0188505.1 UvrD-helicase domain-containing protein [Microbacterium sp. ARD31]
MSEQSRPFEPVRLETPEELRALMGAAHAPSDEQWAAITSPLRPTVVVAGAGSGKTTLMAQRVVWLVATGRVRPEEVLGLTFTTKAAAELRQRVTAALGNAGLLDRSVVAEGEDVLEPTVATYHAYAATLLTDHGLRIGHEPDTRVVSDASRYQLGARVIDRFTGHIELLTDHPATAIQNLLALDGAMSEHLVDEDDVRRVDEEARRGFLRAIEEEQAGKARKTYLDPPAKAIHAIDRRAELLQLVSGYRRLKAELGLMDFGDQIALAARLVEDQPEVGALERARFKVVLLDEYQDTSVAQATMLARLFSGPDPAHGLGHPVMAVGDPNQAIYGWRGASVSNILNFADTFPAADGEPGRLPLTVNRRSDRRILDVANRLAEPLLEAYGDKVARLRPAEIAADGHVEAHVFERAVDELSWLADEVTRVHDAGTAWSDIGVLSRDNAQAEEVYDALTAAGVPVEIVGLSGLVRLPEVAEVVATLTLLHDVTANSSMLTLLTGPRWAIGPRDLRLLALRAAEVAGVRTRAEAATVADQLLQIADGIDASELPALSDALESPGEAAYSADALDRFALLATELRRLRTHVGDPLLDLVRRIIDTTGVDVELASATSPAAAARRDNLDLFVKAVAEFQSVDGDVTLPALLAYLTAEDDQGNGLDVATPTAADSVKLLTVHRAKGLEWSSVFCVGVGETRFPSNRSRTLWTSSPAVLPAPLRGDRVDQPQLAGHDKAALEAYRTATRAHDAEEELRLGYVAYTRAAHHLAVTSYVWGQRSTPFGPSDYQRVVRDQLAEWGRPVERWLEKPEGKAPNPNDDLDPSRPWPVPGPGEEARRRLAAAELVRSADPTAPDEGLDMVEAARVAEWDDDLAQLLAEARAERATTVELPLPSSLSATSVARLRDDPEGFARDLARPMPRPPAPAARFGTAFHAWVEERFGQQALIEPDELPGRADAGIDDEADLGDVVKRFEDGPFADRVPHAVEAPFALVLAGQVVRGRIDAVYAEPAESGGGYLVVDWKTGRHETSDPLQLALYRLAWSELTGVPLEQVRAVFHYVRSGRTVEPSDLPDREALEELLEL